MTSRADFEQELHKLVEDAKAGAQADAKRYIDGVLKKFDSSLSPATTLPYAVVTMRDALHDMNGGAIVTFDPDAAIARIAALYEHSGEHPLATVPMPHAQELGTTPIAEVKRGGGTDKIARGRATGGKSREASEHPTMRNTGLYQDAARYVMNNPGVHIDADTIYAALHDTYPNLAMSHVYSFLAVARNGHVKGMTVQHGHGWIMYSPPNDDGTPAGVGPHTSANGHDATGALPDNDGEGGLAARHYIPQSVAHPPPAPEIPPIMRIENVYEECGALAPIYRGIESFHAALVSARRALRTAETKDAFYKALMAVENANRSDVELGNRRTDFLYVVATKGEEAYPLLQWIIDRKGNLREALDYELKQHGAHVRRSYSQQSGGEPLSYSSLSPGDSHHGGVRVHS